MSDPTDFPIRPWKPSNGTEWMLFMEECCWRCVRERWSENNPDGEQCPILTHFYIENEPPEEWKWDIRTGAARCTAFEA